MKLKICYRKIFPGHRYSLIPELLDGCRSVLDLGCGRTSPLCFCNPQFSVGVDLFEPYLVESRRRNIHAAHVLADITSVEFKPKSFDVVICTEVLEHISKDKGYALVEKMKIWAREKVIITTPNGFCPLEMVDNNENQVHKSGWSVDELERFGFVVRGIRGWLGMRRYFSSENRLIKFMSERASDVTQKLTYYYPRASHRLLGIYSVAGQGNS